MVLNRSVLVDSRPGWVILLALCLLCGSLACTHGEAGDPSGSVPPSSDSGSADDSTGADEPTVEGDSQLVELRMEEPKEVDGMTLEWVELQESRCPKGVNCVWAGEAVVSIEYVAGEESGRIELGLQAREAPSSRNVAGRGLTLLSVEPYPEAEPSAKQVEPRIELRVGAPVDGGPGGGAAVS